MPYGGVILKTVKPPADKKLKTALLRAVDGQRVSGRLHRAFVKRSHSCPTNNRFLVVSGSRMKGIPYMAM